MSIPAFDAAMFTLAADHLARAVESAPSGPLPDIGQDSQHRDWVLANLQAAVSPLPTRLISSLILIQFFQQLGEVGHRKRGMNESFFRSSKVPFLGYIYNLFVNSRPEKSWFII